MNQESDSTAHRLRRVSLLNRAEVRRFILDVFHSTRPTLRIARVSAETFDTLEAWLRAKIRG
ncbi:MAG: hypothetical protein NTV86_09820, partial [Planctomycetota bacterium]|nr:hypothetical protein [Planctomycetota bacterium]